MRMEKPSIVKLALADRRRSFVPKTKGGKPFDRLLSQAYQDPQKKWNLSFHASWAHG